MILGKLCISRNYDLILFACVFIVSLFLSKLLCLVKIFHSLGRTCLNIFSEICGTKCFSISPLSFTINICTKSLGSPCFPFHFQDVTESQKCQPYYGAQGQVIPKSPVASMQWKRMKAQDFSANTKCCHKQYNIGL